MTYRLPLTVKEKLTGYALIDADGRQIAFAETYSWNGVSLEKQPEFALENFKRLAEAANSIDPECTQRRSVVIDSV